MNLEGRLLGNRYEIIENIGNGGMAMVYKAKDQVLNRFVAIKILRDEFTTDEEFIRRFSIEAQSAASIVHPNIVSVFDVGSEGNLYYIVMELIKGKTLKEIIIEEQGALPWKWSTNIAIQICSALETAHKNNIVHRDIKPHNIIITEEGTAKVTDFGIAKAVSNSTITAFGSTIGSVHYFSPEHARGGYTDSKSDLYSLGVVLYEMLTGRVPFDADTPVSVALKHMQEEPKPPKEINNKIPSSINDIILKAMRKDSSLRYQSASEMLRDLSRALKDPEGDFVDNIKYEDKDATKKISSLSHEEIAKDKNIKRKNESFFSKHKKLIVFILIVLLFLLSVFGTIGFLKATTPKEVKVPNIVGITQNEAMQKLKESKLNVGEVKEEYNSEVEKGKIISQSPEGDATRKEETKVDFVLSLGIEKTTVPKVIGKTQDEAVKELEDAKLKYEIKEENSKKVEAGIVIEQDSEPDTTANAGDIVVLHVSKGIEKVQMPNVIGKSEDDAKKELQKIGLKVVVKTEEDTTKENQKIIKQSIDEGTEVEKDSSVTITVNKIIATKTATLTVNVKSILGGKIEYEEVVTENETVPTLEPTANTPNDGTTDNEQSTEITPALTPTPNLTPEIKKIPKNVRVKISVDSDIVYNQSIDPTTTNLVQSISGKGTVTVKVYIDDVLKRTKDCDLNSETEFTIE